MLGQRPSPSRPAIDGSSALAPVHLKSPIDGEALPRYVVRIVGREIERKPCHFPWLARAVPWNMRHLLLARFWVRGPLLRHGRADEAWRDRIHIDAQRCNLER